MCLVSVKEDISFLAAKNLHFVLTKLFISPINFQTYILSVVEELLQFRTLGYFKLYTIHREENRASGFRTSLKKFSYGSDK